MMVIGAKENIMEQDFSSQILDIVIVDHGIKICKMGLEAKNGQMVQHSRVIINLDKNMVKEF